MLRDKTEIEITGFRQDVNRENGIGTVIVIVTEGNKRTKGEVPNTTIEEFVEKASKRIGSKNVINLMEYDRESRNREKKQEQTDISRVMYSFNGRKRSRELA